MLGLHLTVRGVGPLMTGRISAVTVGLDMMGSSRAGRRRTLPAECQGHLGLEKLRQVGYQWLMDTQQEERAGGTSGEPRGWASSHQPRPKAGLLPGCSAGC